MATTLSAIEEDAFALVQRANAISEARSKSDNATLVQALDDNMQLWVEIMTAMARPNNPLPKEIRENLIKLAQFTAQQTMTFNEDTDDKVLQTLIDTNLNISEGLLEAVKKA